MFRRRERGGGFWRRLLLSSTGQSSTEYLGVTIVSALVVLAVAAASPELRAGITDATQRAACTLQNETDCRGNSEGENGGAELLPGEVDPEAPRPEASEAGQIAETGTLGGAGSLEFASGPSGAGTTCFASTQADCLGPSNPPGSIPELSPEDSICPLGEEDNEQCEAGIEELLDSVPEELRDDLESAIAGAIDLASCPGALGGGGTQECDTEKRLLIAALVASQLSQYADDPEEYAEQARDVQFGDEEFPLQESLKSPADCPDDFLSELALISANCKLSRGATIDGLISGVLNFPAVKPFKILKEAGEAGFKKIFKEGAEEGAEETGERAARSLLPRALDSRLRTTFERLRVPYEREVAALGDQLSRLRASGLGEREVAERMFAARQALKAKYLAKTPVAPRLVIYSRNLVKYGSFTGPTFERLLRTKTPSEIAESAARSGGDDLFGSFR